MEAEVGGFPKGGVLFLGAPAIRTVVVWVLYWRLFKATKSQP